MSPDPIRIGVALSDLTEFEAIDPAYGIGDQRAQFESVRASWNREGPLRIHGRELDVVYRTFESTGTASKRATADAFAGDGVLAVVGARDFTYGAVRLAEQHRIPVIDVNAVPRRLLRRTAPWMFTLRTAQDIVYVSFVRWADRTGRLAGRRIGIFSDRFTRHSAHIAIGVLEQLGHRVVEHVHSDGAGVASAQDHEAVDRFRETGVDLVIPFVSGSSMVRMLHLAVDQGYRPSVLDLETGEHATDVTASLTPPEIYDGTTAYVMNRVGELPAGRPLDPCAQGVLSAYERFTGRSLERTGRRSSGELSNVLMVHDLANIVIRALRDVGADPTRSGFVAALERIEAMPTASGGLLTFRAGEHWGFREMRAVRWVAATGTWAVVSEYEPLADDVPDTTATDAS